MRLTSKYRERAESVGQMSMLGDLDALVDFVLFGDKSPYKSVWTEEEVVQMKEKLLSESMDALNDSRLNLIQQEEITSWLFEEPLVDEGVEARPFSFQDCCRVVGVDPLEVQNGMLHVVQSLEKERFRKMEEALERAKPRTIKAIKQWAEEQPAETLFSLERCCQQVGVNPESFRARIFSA